MRLNKKILLVDDSESIREAVSFELEKHGYEVIKATDGLNALEKLNGQRFDLILTDLHMPGKNGMELIRELRKKEDYKYIPILFLTTETQQAIIQEAKKAGATGWISKPFTTENLLKALNKLIR